MVRWAIRLLPPCPEPPPLLLLVGREFTLEQLDGLIEDMTEYMVLDVLELSRDSPNL